MLRIIRLYLELTDLNLRYQDEILIILSSITQHWEGLGKILVKEYLQAKISHLELQVVFGHRTNL
jgi:hypothetical protein